MNTVISRFWSYIAIVALVVIGVASTIATGGGDGKMSPPPNSGPTLAITTANGEFVASAVIIAAVDSFDISQLSFDDLFTQANANNVAASGLPGLTPLHAKTSLPFAATVLGCSYDGTVEVTVTAANPNFPTIGDRLVALFTDCDNNDGYVISGLVELTISALQGDPGTDVSLIAFDTVLTGIEIIEGTDLLRSDGSFTLTIDALDFPVLTMRVAGEVLDLRSNGGRVTLSNFDHALTDDPGTNGKLAVVSGRLNVTFPGGSVDYATPTPIEATADYDPHTGVILVTGANGSKVRIVIVDSTSVMLEIDTNGDGVVDKYVDTSWAALSEQNNSSGDTSTINSSTAPIVAREVFNAVTGFGSVTTTAGGQFVPMGVFGQVRQQAVSGDFGPLLINCLVSGSASVSGSIATAGTFSINDSVEATFTNCVRGAEELDRHLAMTVKGFDATPGDAYLLVATATETDLLRFIDDSCHSGTGTFNTRYDYFYTTVGAVDIQSSANNFMISSGGRTQTLSGAMVNTQFTVGQAPVLISRSSSGSITSADLVGSFTYQSITPDVFFLDNNSDTGPSSGNLLVTASDGSTMKMVAVNELSVRLDLDFDGDATIDQSIMTTWAELGYGNTWYICNQ